jgi:hypothetical protein
MNDIGQGDATARGRAARRRALNRLARENHDRFRELLHEENSRWQQQPREYVFTFGQRDYLGSVHLRHRFVKISGTHMGARLRMFELFGLGWCGQHDSEAAAGVGEYQLTEIALPVPELAVSS